MDHDKYKYILAVAEYQSFSKAADALFISQPYLSKVVSTIEATWESVCSTETTCRFPSLPQANATSTILKPFCTRNNRCTLVLLISASTAGNHQSGNRQHPLLLSDADGRCIPGAFRICTPISASISTECSNKTMVEYVENGSFDFALYTSPDIPRNLTTSIKKNAPPGLFRPATQSRDIGKNPSQAVQTLGRDDMYKLSKNSLLF